MVNAKTGDSIDNYDSEPSMLLTARFGYASTKLIHSVEKNLYVVLVVIVSTATLSIVNTLGILNFLFSEDIDYPVDVILSVILVAVLVPLIILIIKSRKVLDNWDDMFERNTIATSMNIAMTERSRQEALKALAQSVGEISEPLQDYVLSRKSDLSEFLNVGINANLKFDVLIDTNQVLDYGSANSNNLRRILEDYGSLAIKIIDGLVDENSVKSFVDSLSKYASLTKNKVGLGLMIGEEVTTDAKKLARKSSYLKKRKINNLLLLAKPSIHHIRE